MRKGDDSSKMDSISNLSGMMSRNTKKRSIRKGGTGGGVGGKRSASLAAQNEIVI